MGDGKDNFLDNTFDYIECYLKPSRKWNRETPAWRRIDLIRYANMNWATVSTHIKSMNYQDFLATPYWKAISAHTKYKAGYRCLLCTNRTDLITHHRDYSIHGREHAHIDELVVLCFYCHQKFHQKEKIVISSSSAPNALVPFIVMVITVLFFLVAVPFIYKSF